MKVWDVNEIKHKCYKVVKSKESGRIISRAASFKDHEQYEGNSLVPNFNFTFMNMGI